MAIEPVGLPQLAAFAVGLVAMLLAMLAARRRRAAEAGGTHARKSWLGLAVQVVGVGIGGFGPIRVALDPASPRALGMAALVAVLMVAMVGLFVWSTRTMGRNWSIHARTRDDHSLVMTGPFAWVRHPIYVGFGLFGVAMALAYGHPRNLILAVPVYAFGTWLRIREEERLLRDAFGAEYDAYAARVRRFLPGVF